MGIEFKKLKDIKITSFNNGIELSFKNQNNKSCTYNWSHLTNSIESEGFLPEKYGYMVISKDCYILDGHHRYFVLNKKHGEDYEIKVSVGRLNYVPLLLSIFVLTFISFLVRKLFNKNIDLVGGLFS